MSKFFNKYKFYDLYHERSYQEAYEFYRHYVEKHPKLSKKGDTYVQYAELELLSNDDVQKAQDFLDKAIKLGCTDMSSYYRILGYILWRHDDNDKAIQYLQKSVTLNSKIENLLTYGRFLSHTRNKQATEIWQKVLKLDPKNCLAHIYLGIEASLSGDNDNALSMAKNAEKLVEKINDLFQLGDLYYQLGLFQKALSIYLNCDKMNYPHKSSIYSAIASCYYWLDNYDNSIKYADKVLRIERDNEYAKDVLYACRINTWGKEFGDNY
jgi:tetratricopeptide (TPR) repeat protein